MSKCIYLFILLFLFDTAASAQYIDTVIRYFDFYDNEVDKRSKDAYIYSVARKTADNKWHVKDYYVSTGTLQMEGMYRGKNIDVQDGQFFYYHSNGQLAVDCTYNDCNRVGLYRTYTKTVSLRIRCVLKTMG